MLLCSYAALCSPAVCWLMFAAGLPREGPRKWFAHCVRHHSNDWCVVTRGDETTCRPVRLCFLLYVLCYCQFLTIHPLDENTGVVLLARHVDGRVRLWCMCFDLTCAGLLLAGTVFLFIMWPSFNAAPSSPSGRMRALPNTLLSLMGAVLATFLMSYITTHKLDMVHIQNSTLAGACVSSCEVNSVWMFAHARLHLCEAFRRNRPHVVSAHTCFCIA